MQAKDNAKVGRHLVAAIISVPGLPFVADMHRDIARKAFLHIWGDAEPPEVATIVIMVEGEGASDSDSFPSVIQCTLADIEMLKAKYESSKKDTKEDTSASSEDAMTLAIGTPHFCKAVVGYWAADRKGVASWGERMFSELEHAPPCTFVWMDGKDNSVNKTNIFRLADQEESVT